MSSPFLGPLTDALATRLASPPADPFASEFVVVPNIGVRDWLQRELSSRLDSGRNGRSSGIVANVRFMFVQQFLDTIFTASNLSNIDDWDIEHLTWSVHRAIDSMGRSVIPGASTKPLAVARVIADLFDRYGVHRPSMLRYWSNGREVDAVEPLQELPGHLRWQPRLYTEVRRLIGNESPSDRLAALARGIGENGIADVVPERIALFGFVTVNSTVRSVVEALGTARECNIFLVHPARKQPSGPMGSMDRLQARDHQVVEITGSPLLARWGRSALETCEVLAGEWTSAESPDSVPMHDLDRLRRSIVDDQPMILRPIADRMHVLDSSDGSLQIHSCHGRVRQVEVLRDALLHLLADDPTLTLSDISIQCPDLVSFAPIIPAIFRSGQSRSDATAPPLDVSIADRSLSGENPYLDAFWALLGLAGSRCGVAEMLSTLASPPLQRRFDIDEDLLARLADWVESLNVRFGLDVEHRRKWNLPDSITSGTWDSALDRLFMGLAVPAEELFEGPGGVVPHDDIAVTDAPMLARVGDFLALVRQLVGRIDSVHTVREWADIFTSILDDFFNESESSDIHCKVLVDAIDRLVGAADRAHAADQDAFAFVEINMILDDLISSASGRPRFRSGAITVTELLPQQGVPYRVIALLGVNEVMFSTSGAQGDDVLSLRPCIGDPMPSVSGRLQLLNVLLAAEDAVISTCDGADINNNKPIPLPVPIQELLEAMAVVREHEPSSGSVKVFTQHPRQSFSARALVPGSFRSDRPFTFDPVALDMYERRRRDPEPVLAGHISRRNSSAPPVRVSAEQLRRVLVKPADYFVRDLLGMRLPPTDSGSSHDFIDFWPSNLDVSSIGRHLLDGVLRSTAEPEEEVRRLVDRMVLGGSFPPGRLGDSAAAQVGAEVLAVFGLLPEAARHLSAYQSVEIDELEIGASSSGASIIVSGSVDDIIDHEILRVSFTRYREDMLLDPWIDLALLTLVDPDQPWSVRLVCRGAKGEGHERMFGLVGATREERRAQAVRVVVVVQTLLTCMTEGRVPYLPKTADKIHRSSLEGARSTYMSEGEYSAPIRFLFGRVSWEAFSSEPALDDDPDGSSSIRAERFASLVWDAFRETTTASAAEVDAEEDS
ncbi:MAG: exodeoxyribonuclease V subunit gamma [Actinomycetota bacterium]